MTRNFRSLLFLSATLLAISSCKQDDDQVSGPGITRRIREFEDYACSGGMVTRYDYQNTEVFLFEQNCGVYDESFPVYDLDGNQICYIGGFAGMGDCRGTRFDKEAKNPKVIYTKP